MVKKLIQPWVSEKLKFFNGDEFIEVLSTYRKFHPEHTIRLERIH